MERTLKLFILLGAFFVTGCTNQEQKSQVEAEQKITKIVIGSVGSDAEIWQFIADSDLAKNAGLAINVKEIDGGPQLIMRQLKNK